MVKLFSLVRHKMEVTTEAVKAIKSFLISKKVGNNGHESLLCLLMSEDTTNNMLACSHIVTNRN